MSRTLSVTLPSLLLLSAPAPAAQLDLAETRQLVERAAERFEQQGLDDAPTIRQHVRLRFNFDDNAPEGRLDLAWTGRERVRMEWLLPGYHQVAGLDGDEGWHWTGEGSDPQLLQLATRLRPIAAPGGLLRGNPESPARLEEIDGRTLARVSLPRGADADAVAWIDPDSAELVSAESGSARLDFAGSRELAGHRSPMAVRMTWDGEPFVSARYGKPELLSGEAAGIFTRPEGARDGVSSTFIGLEHPLLLHAPDPVYPERAKKRGLEATVVVRIRIDAEGAVHDPQLLAPPAEGPMKPFTESALEAVAGRRYEPGRLMGTPVEVLSTVRIAFRLKSSQRKSGVQVFRKRSAGAR